MEQPNRCRQCLRHYDRLRCFAVGTAVVGCPFRFAAGGGSSDFTYDHDHQLTAVTTTSGYAASSVIAETFSFTANGNRDAAGYSTGSDNQMLTAPPPAAGQHVQYEYDPEGNTRFCTVYDQYDNILQQTTYTWDYRNRLVAVVFDPDGLSPSLPQVSKYAYNAQDQRVSK
jgi:hypothetical protein